MILLEVSDDGSSQCVTTPRVKPPATKLFVIQRVNRAFQATIARNQRIQERMYLAPCTENTTLISPDARLYWFSNNFHLPVFHHHYQDRFIRQQTPKCGDNVLIAIRRFDFPTTRKYHPSLDKFWKKREASNRPEASWRQMKLYGIGKGGNLEIDLLRRRHEDVDRRRFVLHTLSSAVILVTRSQSP